MTYGSGTVTGTTMSTTSSWLYGSTTGVGIGNVDVTFGNDFGGSTTSSVDMQQTSNQSQTFVGPAADSINHDYDQIRIYLGVNINASVDYLGHVTWSPDFSQITNKGFATNGYPIAVGCLRSNSTIPVSQCTTMLAPLSSAGITSADYPSILGADPFADPAASPTPDPARYVLIYAMPYSFDPTYFSSNYSLYNSITYTNSTMLSYSYSVSADWNNSIAGLTLANSKTLTWTSLSTWSNSTGNNNSSTFTLTNPSSAYSGPTTLHVYLDTIYKTFMFSFN